MKLARYILSLYILMLSCLPCADIETDFGNETTVAQSHEKEHTDNCSPFCICSCCGNQIAFESQTLVLLPQIHFFTEKNKSDNYTPQFVSNFYGNIWQPPKISETV